MRVAGRLAGQAIMGEGQQNVRDSYTSAAGRAACECR